MRFSSLRLLLFVSILAAAPIGVLSYVYLSVDINYPETGINFDSSSSDIFGIRYSSNPYTPSTVEFNGNIFHTADPWWGNWSAYINVNAFSNRVGPNNWRIKIPIFGVAENKRVFVLISDRPGPGDKSTINACDRSTIYNGAAPTGRCIPRNGAYFVDMQPHGNYSLSVYPAFNTIGQGRVETIYTNFWSKQFLNLRNISLYRPNSLLENPLRRVINVLILHDGDEEFVSYLALQGGFDAAVLSGAIPECIIIGIPPGQNGTYCTDISCQRPYEMNPISCNPSLTEVCNELWGGGDLYLDFIWDDVIPAVITIIDQIRGEVSSTGSSLGGNMPCYASSTRPDKFERLFSMSLRYMKNWDQLVRNITYNYRLSGVRPKSIVIHQGTQEGDILTYHPNPNVKPEPFYYFDNLVIDAFREIGMNDTNLMYFRSNGGVHTGVSWGDVFAYGITQMFRPEFPDSTKLQMTANFPVVFPKSSKTEVIPTDGCFSDDKLSSTDIALIAALLVVSFLFVTLIFAYVHLLSKSFTQSSRDTHLTDQENPMARSIVEFNMQQRQKS
jgi:predicted alpha/beta superfamily hydrolase